MAKFVNLTPHPIVLNDGTIFEPSGNVARVSSQHGNFDLNRIALLTFGEVEGLPEHQEGVFLIVSALVQQVAGRPDVVAPATGHRDCRRNEKGHIVSVPGFVRQ